MGKHFLLVVVVFWGSAYPAIGQKEGNNWYFGNGAAITFNGGTPVSLAGGAIHSWEGVAAVSDTNGKLLFYTDGSTVYNANNAVMSNGTGLLGNPSSTQSAIIVKQPGSETLYYVFTVDCYENSGRNGLRYSIVDLSLNGGLGGVTTTKNVLLRNIALEKLTVIPHRNKQDFWILINDYAEDDIFAYLLSCKGVSSTPVKSNAGPINKHTLRYLTGYMKGSQQNDRLALAISYENAYAVFDFDNSTGLASNKKFIQNAATSFGTTYGVEFSPDGNLLYGTTIGVPRVFQFNLNAGSGDDIFRSKRLLAYHAAIYTLNYYYYGALQLGPDGKIYSADNGDYFLGVINHPNTPGPGCDYVNGAVSLGGQRCYLGLPAVLTDYILPRPPDTVRAAICKGDAYTLPDGSKVSNGGVYTSHLSSAAGCDSVVITRVAIKSPVSTVLKVAICEGSTYDHHTRSGVFIDTLVAANGCDSIVTLTFTVIPRAYSFIDTAICAGQSYAGYSSAGFYNDTLVAVSGCDSFRTVHLTVIRPPDPKLPGDRALCEGDSLVLDPGPFDSYVWQDGSTGSRLSVSTAGEYSVIAGNRCGTAKASVTITLQKCRVVFPNTFTPNADGRNDVFRPLHAYRLSNYQLTIFNRWGVKVFHTENYPGGWDGRIDGRLAPAGTYVWICEYSNANNIPTSQQGTVILVR